MNAAKTERFEMRFDQATLDSVDAWRARQDDVPSRTEAMRRLIDAGLSSGAARRAQLTDGEKLITLMLADIFRHLKVRSDIEPKFVEAVIHGGHYWAFDWEYPGIYHRHEDSTAVVGETVNILDMWWFIENGYEKLSKKDQQLVQKEAELLGGHEPKFPGFDGNNESEYLSITRFLIEELKRFTDFKGRDLNSHFPSVDGYRRMLKAFEPIRRNLMGTGMTAAMIVDVLKARRWPGNREDV